MNQMFKKVFLRPDSSCMCRIHYILPVHHWFWQTVKLTIRQKQLSKQPLRGLTETIIPLTDKQIEAYMESGDDFTENAMTAWNGAKEELGDMKETGSVEIEYSNDEYTATVPVTFEKRKC